MTNAFRLMSEWAPQDAILLVWPDQYTDWQPWLDDVQNVYLDIIEKLNTNNTPVILLLRKEQQELCLSRLGKTAKVIMVTADYNDTWIRDYGFLTCSNGSDILPIEFKFNGWGQKFDASKDNLINQKVLSKLCQKPITPIELVVEGGALEIDQHGRLLSTEFCLSNPKRNGNKSITSYEHDFARFLGAKTTTVLKHGHLDGDDTDGHIDTLVRYTPDNGLVIQSAFNRPSDSHFQGLSALVTECKQAFPKHKIFELPLPKIFNADGIRLPASYANYLMSNRQILCPIYQQPEDELAIQTIQNAYPNFKVVPVNCLPLVQQFGSLHCISMQVPCGVLKPDILQHLCNGIYRYE